MEPEGKTPYLLFLPNLEAPSTLPVSVSSILLSSV
jgi:hypothetical protein